MDLGIFIPIGNMGSGVKTPEACASTTQRLVEACAKTGRDGGSDVLFTVIVDDTDATAEVKWQRDREGAHVGALRAAA